MAKRRSIVIHSKRPGLVNRLDLRRVIDRIKIRMNNENDWDKKVMWATIGQELNNYLIEME